MVETIERVPLIKPVYVTYSNVEDSLRRLKEHGLPPVIDTTAFDPALDKGVRSQVRSALRYLNLIDDKGNVRQALIDLVGALDTPQWPVVFGDVITKAYKHVVGDLDLRTASMGMLTAAFASHAQGQVLEKAIRFYLTALKQTGTPLSGHLDSKGSGAPTVPSKRVRAPRRPRVEDVPTTPTPPAPPAELPLPEGWIKHAFPLRRDLVIELRLPIELTKADVARLHTWLNSLPVDSTPAAEEPAF